MYKFPNDEELKQRWIRSIPRQNWTLSPQHRVCKKHFEKKDFLRFSLDSNSRRRVTRGSQRLLRLRLKDGAVPGIFPDLPLSLSKAKSVARHRDCSVSARFDKEEICKEQTNAGLLHYDSIKDFASMKEKLQNRTLPDGYIMYDRADSIQFHYLESSEDLSVSPKLLASVIVKKNLEVGVFIKSTAVPRKLYNHLLKSKCLQSVFELSNILSLCKTLSHEELLSSDDTVHLDMASSHLQRYVGCELNTTNEESHISLVRFIIEQLSLIQQPRYGRRYSADLIFKAFSWKLTSAACYKTLQDFFVLPCVTQLRRLSTAMTVESCRQALDYLRERGANFTDSEFTDAFMDDEED